MVFLIGKGSLKKTELMLSEVVGADKECLVLCISSRLSTAGMRMMIQNMARGPRFMRKNRAD